MGYDQIYTITIILYEFCILTMLSYCIIGFNIQINAKTHYYINDFDIIMSIL